MTARSAALAAPLSKRRIRALRRAPRAAQEVCAIKKKEKKKKETDDGSKQIKMKSFGTQTSEKGIRTRRFVAHGLPPLPGELTARKGRQRSSWTLHPSRSAEDTVEEAHL